MKELRKLQVALLSMAMLVTMLSYGGPAHALTPTITGTCSPGNSVNVCGPFTTAVNDVVVVAVQINSAGAGVISVTSVTDGGDTFAQQVSKTVTCPADCSNPYPAKVEIWSALHLSGASITVTILLSGATISYDMEVISIAGGVAATAIATSTGSCIKDPGICGTILTSPTNSLGGGSIAVGSMAGWGLSTITPGTGFTPVPSPCSTQAACLEYSTSASSPTGYPMNCATCGSSNIVAAALAGAIFSNVSGSFTVVITNMDAGNYLLANGAKFYDFKATVDSSAISGTNARITDVQVRFNDSVNIITVEYNNDTNAFSVVKGSGFIQLGGGTVTSTILAGVRTIVVHFKVSLANTMIDAKNRGIELQAANANSVTRSFEYVQKNYFNIINQGGQVDQKVSGVCSVPAGADTFQTLCQYQASPKSWIAQNSTWYHLQQYSAQFSIKLADNFGNPDMYLWQDYGNSGAGAEDSTNPGDWKINVGLYHYDNSTWVKGINAVISMVDGNQAPADQWTRFNIAWYHGSTLIIKQNFTAWIEQNPLSQTSLWVNLWYSQNNASTSQGGRVAAYYTGMHNSGFLWWSSWSPLIQNDTQSEVFTPLLDHNGKTMSSSVAQFSKVFMNMSRPGVNAVHAKQPNFQVITRAFQLQDFLRSNNGIMSSVDTPVFAAAVIPQIQNNFFLTPLIKAVQSIANFFIGGLQYLGTVVWNGLGSRFPWFTSALGNFSALVVSFSNLLGLIGGYLGNFLSFLSTSFAPVVSIITVVTNAWATIQGIYLPIFTGANLTGIITIVVLWVFWGWFMENAEKNNTGAFVGAATLAWRVTNAILLWTWSFAKILIDTIEGLIP